MPIFNSDGESEFEEEISYQSGIISNRMMRKKQAVPSRSNGQGIINRFDSSSSESIEAGYSPPRFAYRRKIFNPANAPPAGISQQGQEDLFACFEAQGSVSTVFENTW